MNSKMSDRRGFLKRSAALAGLAAFANGKALASVTPGLVTGVADTKLGVTPDEPTIQDLLYGGRSSYEKTIAIPSIGTLGATGLRTLTPLQDTIGVITPAPYHYLVQGDTHIPNIDPSKHTLIIHGMVDRPTVFTMEELKRLPSVSRVHFLECTGNSGLAHYKTLLQDLKKGRKDVSVIQGVHGRTSTSEWTGVLLSVLLKEVGVQKGATWFVAEGGDIQAELHAKSIPLAKGMDDVMIAYGQNGEAIRREQGYPIRLFCPGFQGVCSVKHVSSIKLVDKAYMMQREITAYTNLKPNGMASRYESQVGPKSLITFPSDAHKLPGTGFYELSGIAWCGRGKIARVEVTVDGGRTWKDANLQQPIFSKAWTRFRLPWTWNGAETVIASRCTNEFGELQSTMEGLAKLWGDDVTPHIPAAEIERWWANTNIAEFLNNPIQFWTVKTDGSVADATYAPLYKLPV
ncbi:MAG: molybdopterin-dependent oxidoreductase [Acidobacteriia bacterium]|nr:molybdopterin-dependent oxidoreductase [Terriglobia bacterium]